MSFRTALSGLNAATTDLNVTGNNIANASTSGFKQSRAEFADVYAIAYSGISDIATGSGVRVSAVTQEYSQGNVEFTSNNLDLAVNGQGFFVLDDNGAAAFTRSGAFRVDREGYVVNADAMRLQVYPASAGGNFNTGALTDLQLQDTEGAPQATSLIDAGLNLDATDTTPALPFNENNPDTYNAATSAVVYDSLGAPHTATTYYRLTATPTEWDAYLFIDGTQITSGGNSPVTLDFNPDGSLNDIIIGGAPTGSTTVPYDNYVPTTGALPISMGIDYTDTTQYGGPFAVNSLLQDGYATGRLAGIDVNDEGVVQARYTNGQSQVMGKVALANFPNPQGLRQLGGTAWAETFDAGTRRMGEAGSGTFGLIQSGALEASNVDVAEQLVNLITAQRNFQANAQVITTEDTVTQTIINIR